MTKNGQAVVSHTIESDEERRIAVRNINAISVFQGKLSSRLYSLQPMDALSALRSVTQNKPRDPSTQNAARRILRIDGF